MTVHTITAPDADQAEQVAAALEEAAARVRAHWPAHVEVEHEDHVEAIDTGVGSVPGPRSPALRAFRIVW